MSALVTHPQGVENRLRKPSALVEAGMDRIAAAMSTLALLAASAVSQAQVVQGALELRWGDAAPAASGPRPAPVFHATLVLDGGARIALDPDQARRGAGDLYALANRRVAVQFSGQFSGAKSSSGRRTVEAIVPADAAHAAQPHVLAGKADDGVTSATLGTTRWITLACRFGDIAEEQRSIGFFRGQYGEAVGQLGHYWREVSYGKINLTGSDARGWYALPKPRSHYMSYSSSEQKDEANLDALFDDCTAAADADVDFSQVVGINLMFNGDLDGYAWGGGSCATLDGESRCWSVTWNPPWSFNNLAPLAHEMGHGYGLPHSDNSDGDADTYDNPWDVMSDSWSNAVVDGTYGSRPKHVNVLQRDRLGWIDAARRRTIVYGAARTRVALDYASLAGGDNARMLVLQAPQSADPYRSTAYTVEARRPTGAYEAALAGNAVIIHKVGGDYYRYVAQSMDADRPPANVANNEGSMFKVGESWMSPDSLFSLYVESSTATGFVVVVESEGRETGGNGPRRRKR